MNNFQRTLLFAGIFVLTVGAVGFFAARKAGDTIASLGQAINPVDPGNVFNRGTNAVVQAVTGDPNATLGDRLFALFNPGAPGEQRTDIRDTRDRGEFTG